MQPAWTLFGAGALIGFYLRHRQTRDLDLAFRPRLELGDIPREVEARLRRAGLDVAHLQTAVSFARFQVRDGSEVIDLDLVADPTAPVEEPQELSPGVFVDTLRDLFAQKLCALLSRTELRDLEDVGALLDAGLDLPRGLADAATRDGGFSPPTLAWLLESFPIARAGEEGRDQARLQAVRDRLMAALKA
jgi:hypothetical protein